MDPASTISTPLPLKGARNTRDLGGYAYRAVDGTRGVTASGAFLRSGSLTRLRAADREFLRAYGLTRVVDIRSDFEVRHWPDPYSRRPESGVGYVHIPMLDQLNSSGFRGALPECMFDVYRDLLDDSASSIRRVFEALDTDGCALFHCRAGKDRTGVIAMLLLRLAGVSDEDIVADYVATQRYMGHTAWGSSASLPPSRFSSRCRAACSRRRRTRWSAPSRTCTGPTGPRGTTSSMPPDAPGRCWIVSRRACRGAERSRFGTARHYVHSLEQTAPCLRHHRDLTKSRYASASMVACRERHAASAPAWRSNRN